MSRTQPPATEPGNLLPARQLATGPATGNQEAAAPAAEAPTREILSENVEHVSRGEGEADDTEAATGGTAPAPTG